MNPVMLQKQLKENAADLNEFYKELKVWGEGNKRKEESSKKSYEMKTSTEKRSSADVKKKKKSNPKEQCKAKLGYTDYSAWEKFDVEAECEKVDYDENEESDLSDECDEALREEAYLEKEKGNTFVKEKKWVEAIECYNKAIGCYSYDPVFYANRALCFLKTEEHVKAELDCTMSLKLDSTYVKAFQRRAAAREALGKLSEAESDLLKVLEFEPKNQESNKNLMVLRKKFQKQTTTEIIQRPISKFTASRNKKKIEINQEYSNSNETNFKKQNVSSHLWPDYSENIIPVKAIVKPTHLQCKKPLERIKIQEISGYNEPENKTQQPTITNLTSLKTDDLKVVEKHNFNETKENKNQINMMNKNQFASPTNAVQFYSQWKYLQTIDHKYSFIKTIKPENLPIIFKECMESNIFSEILEVLVKGYVKNNEDVFDFLKFFPEMRRFSTLVLFMNNSDKKYLRILFDFVRQNEGHAKEEIESIFSKYEL